VVFLDLRRLRRRKKAAMVIAVKANNVQPTLMPAAMLFDSECEVGDVDDAGNADVGVDAILVELKAVNVAARVEDV